MDSSSLSIASDEIVKVDRLGREYKRPPGPKPQSPELIARHVIRVRLSTTEHSVACTIASVDETTLSDVIREALAEYASTRLRAS